MMGEIRNIPAIWNALALFCAQLMYISLLRKRTQNKIVWVLTLVLTLGAEILLMEASTRLNGLSFNILMTSIFLISVIPYMFLTNAGLSLIVYMGSRGIILGGFISSLAWQICVFLLQYSTIWSSIIFESIVVISIAAIVITIMYLLERRNKKQIRDMTFSVKSSITTLIMAYVIYVLSSISFSTLNTPFGGNTLMDAFNLRTIVYLAGVSLLYAHHIVVCESAIAVEKEMLQNLLNAQYTNMQLSQESIDIVNQKYHDLKHQIALLKSNISSEEKLEFLDQMEQEILIYEAQNKTGNNYLDTILTGKSIHCQKEQITLTSVADGSLISFMDPMDISALFGNALDNAIEAVSKIKDPEKRLIHLSVSQQKNFVRIHVENSFENDLIKTGHFPKTTKLDSRYHGFGIKSIKAISNKYHGSCTVHFDNNWFELRVLIPLKDKT